MSPADVLRNARELIKDEKHWCKEHYAVNSAGYPVPAGAPEATSFCSIGALYRQKNLDGLPYLVAAAKQVGYHSLSYYNDTHSHQDILDLYDRAIQLAEQDYPQD